MKRISEVYPLTELCVNDSVLPVMLSDQSPGHSHLVFQGSFSPVDEYCIPKPGNHHCIFHFYEFESFRVILSVVLSVNRMERLEVIGGFTACMVVIGSHCGNTMLSMHSIL